MLDSFMLINPDGQQFIVAVRNSPDYKQSQMKALELVKAFIPDAPPVDIDDAEGDTVGPIYLTFEYRTN